jgi:hypothetical protein
MLNLWHLAHNPDYSPIMHSVELALRLYHLMLKVMRVEPASFGRGRAVACDPSFSEHPLANEAFDDFGLLQRSILRHFGSLDLVGLGSGLVGG